jgi:hypothetical protein
MTDNTSQSFDLGLVFLVLENPSSRLLSIGIDRGD